MGTLANSEDPDEMPLNVAFHQSLHCLLKRSSEKEIKFLGLIITCDPSIYELCHEISNNVVCVTSKPSDQPVRTRSLIRALASRLNILLVLNY